MESGVHFFRPQPDSAASNLGAGMTSQESTLAYVAVGRSQLEPDERFAGVAKRDRQVAKAFAPPEESE